MKVMTPDEMEKEIDYRVQLAGIRLGKEYPGQRDHLRRLIEREAIMREELGNKPITTLALGANAEPNTCGSCKFFRRDRDYDSASGKCEIVLPKKLASQRDIRSIDPKQKDREYTGNEDQIKDTDRCDLYKSDGKQYIVQRIVGPYTP